MPEGAECEISNVLVLLSPNCNGKRKTTKITVVCRCGKVIGHFDSELWLTSTFEIGKIDNTLRQTAGISQSPIRWT